MYVFLVYQFCLDIKEICSELIDRLYNWKIRWSNMSIKKYQYKVK